MDGLPLNVETVDHMDPNLYKAAIDGEIEAFKDYKGRLNCLVTRNKNTVLHVHLANRRPKAGVFNAFNLIYPRYYRAPALTSTNFIEHLLHDCPSLLLQANDKGEIPLRIEARYGHYPTVKSFLQRTQQEDLEKGIEATKEMLRKKDKEENTPSHISAQYGHLEVMQALIEADPDFLCPANKNGETPLYIAARRGYHHLVDEMLTKCKLVDHAGPKGSTALHAAVMSKDREMVRILLEKKKFLANETGDKGRSALHFAAHLGYRSIVKQLLECDNSAAYIADSEGKMTALHMATRQGHISIMKDIILHCPECCELVDERGWNFLHLAVVTYYGVRWTGFLRDDFGTEYVTMTNLLVQKDEYGNTPLQLLVIARAGLYDAAKLCKQDIMQLSKDNLTVAEEQVMKLVDEVSKGEVAGIPVRPFPIFTRPDPTGFEKTKESQLVVAALIATVTFAAAFTMPGGYKNEGGPDQGTAILIRNAAFIMFVISDAIAIVSSLLAVFFYFLMAHPGYQKAYASYPVAFFSTLLAVRAMVIAFVTGAFAMLQPSLGLALSTCFIGLSFFLLCSFFNFVT